MFINKSDIEISLLANPAYFKLIYQAAIDELFAKYDLRHVAKMTTGIQQELICKRMLDLSKRNTSLKSSLVK